MSTDKEMVNIYQAMSEGKTIEQKHSIGTWHSMRTNLHEKPSGSDGYKYRIKRKKDLEAVFCVEGKFFNTRTEAIEFQEMNFYRSSPIIRYIEDRS